MKKLPVSVQFYTVSTFVTQFYYGSETVINFGSGSATAKSYGSAFETKVFNKYPLCPGGASRSPEAGEEASPPSLLAQHPGLACMGLAHAQQQQAPVLAVLSAEKLLGRREVARPDSAGPQPPPAPLFSRTGQL
jgi:hypothetical protein